MVIVFLEINGLGFGGNTFARIINELAAFFPALNHAPLGAKILFIFQAGTVLAVFTATGHLLAKKHGVHLISSMALSYTNQL